MYFTDRGIEELAERLGAEQMTLGWVAARLQSFAGLHPGFDVPAGRPPGRLVPMRTVNRDRRVP